MKKLEKDLQEAYKLRFEFFNLYENKEERWHKKYSNHKLYTTVVKSFQYNFSQIGVKMPQLIEEFNLSS